VLDRTRLIRFKRSPQHGIAVSLHGTILEHASAAMGLLVGGNASAAFILTRAAFEALADLENLVTDPTYADDMRASHFKQLERRLRAALGRSSSNPYLASLAADPSSASELTSIQADLQSLAAKGKTPLTALDRFTKAGMLDVYDGPYSAICGHSHNDLGVLQERHVKFDSSGAPQILYFQEPTDEDVTLVVDTLAGILANSIACLVSLVDSQNAPALPTIDAKLKAVRALWKP